MELRDEQYPEAILPRKGYRWRMGVERLLSVYPNLMVVRLVDGETKAFTTKTDCGKERVLTTVFKNNMANLSLNLAGGKFNTRSNE